MTEKNEISGRWWIHGKSARPLGGVLSQEGELALKIVIPAGTPVDKVFTKTREIGPPQVPDVIHGRDSQDKPVTLFGCFCHSHTMAQGEEIYEILALAGVQGCEIDSWQKPVVRTVMVRLQHLHRWLETKVLESVPLPDGKSGWRTRDYSAQLFPIAEGIDFRITESSTESHGQDADRFKPDCRACLTFATPRSLEEVCDNWTRWIAHFFSLLAGTNLRTEEIIVSEVDLFGLGNTMEDAAIFFSSQATVLGRTQSKSRERLSNPNPYDMVAPYSAVRDRLGTMLQQWLVASERLDPVVGLFTSVVFHHALYATAEFLFLAQALEVYHVRSGHFSSHLLPPKEHKKKVEEILKTVPAEHVDWVKRKLSANYKQLNERILEVFQANESIAKIAFGNLQETAEKITYTRNHYTHYTNNTDHEKFLDQSAIARLNFSLELFLWALLLREIGAPHSAGEKILSSVRTARFTGLSGVATNSPESKNGCLGLLAFTAPLLLLAGRLLVDQLF